MEDTKSWRSKVLLNNIRLNSCKKHLFKTPHVLTVDISTSLECVLCGGKLLLANIHEYMNGLIASGGDPNEVWPGYTNNKPDEMVVRCPECLGELIDVSYGECILCNNTGMVSKKKAREYFKLDEKNNLN